MRRMQREKTRISSFLLGACLAVFGLGCDSTGDDSIFHTIPGEILFLSPDSTGTSQLFSMNAEGGDVRQISFEADFPIVAAVWSPDGQHIALLSLKGWVKFYGPALYIVDSDGANPYQLLQGSEPNAASGRYPLVWSPDSKKIAFKRLLVPEALGVFKTFVSDTDGRDLVTLGNDHDSEEISDWKADGSTLLGHADGLVFDSLGRRIEYSFLSTWSLLDGQRSWLLGDPGESLLSPKWSPDEAHMVFALSRNGQQDLYTALSDGSEARLLTNSEFKFIRPVAWSADGKILARGFSRNRDGDWISRIVFVDVETGSVTDASPFPDVDNIPMSWLGND